MTHVKANTSISLDTTFYMILDIILMETAGVRVAEF